MPHGEEFSNTSVIKVDGSALPVDVESLLVEVCVDQSLLVPDHFQLRFHDKECTVLDKGKFKVGAQIEIAVQTTDTSGPAKLLMGEVTAMEVESREGGLHTVVRGMDKAHRMQRGTHHKVYTNMKASDIANQVASASGLTVGAIDATTGVRKHTVQLYESNWDFLQRLAVEHNRVCHVVDGKVRFVKLPTAQEGPTSADPSTEPRALVHGENLVDVRATLTSAALAEKVWVRGWDPKQKKAVVAQKSAASTSADKTGTATPAGLAGPFSGAPEYVLATAGFNEQHLADDAADAINRDLSGGSAEVEGTARGNVKLHAGTAVAVLGIGIPFNGKYVLTSTRHTYSPEHGYRTEFVASNTSERSLYGSTRPGSASTPSIDGLVPAIVSDTKDPEKLGRVKIKIPWLADDFESDWARVAQPGAGKDRGMTVIPEPGDEVLVGFAHGDIHQPYVIGGLFNGKDKPREGSATVGGSGAIERRAWVSRTGMEVAFEEKQGTEQLVVCTDDRQQTVTLKQKPAGGGIEIVSKGPVKITAEQDVTVESPTGNVSVNSKSGNVSVASDGGNMDLKAVNVTIEAKATLTLKGAIAELSASGPTTVKGALVSIN